MSEIATVAEPSRIITAVFNLDDADERFMVGVLQRFHSEDCLYRAHALKRIESTAGRVVVEVASFNPPKRTCRFLLIYWEIDTVAIRFKDYESLKTARAVFDAA